jgi:protoheme ferro-lyase
VALVLHGQPEAWQKSHASFDVQENSFANRVRATLIDRGLHQENIRLCYAEWRNPDITETVRHLAALGCSRVLICPACFPFESSVTILDMPVAVRQARVDAHVSTVVLGAWGDGPRLVDVLGTTVRWALHDSE